MEHIQPVYTLLCQRDLPMALITVPRIVSFLQPGQKFIIYDDGSFTESAIQQLSSLSDSINIVTHQQRTEEVNDALSKYPNCLKYRTEFPLAFKMLDIPLDVIKSGGGRYTFTDSDIIYLRNAHDYFNRDVNTYLRTDAIKLSVKLQDVLLKYKWKVPYKFNSGYFSFDVKDFDFDFVDHYLGMLDVRNMPWLSEQTCWALLFGMAGKSYCPKENEFVCREQFNGPEADTLAIHLIGKLKNKYEVWSKVEGSDGSSPKPSFELSRNVTMLDWVQKSARRFFR
jgi:hypothetical protein